jgi:RNA polymerase sigma-70 factor, ECF subfamily
VINRNAHAQPSRRRLSRSTPVARAPQVWSDSNVPSAPEERRIANAPTAERPTPRPVAARSRLEGLFKQHSGYVSRLAYRLLGREDEVDDVVQEVFMILHRHLDRIRELDALPAWLGTTTVRVSRRRLRLRRIGFLLRVRDRVDPIVLTSVDTTGEDRAALAGVHRALASVSASARVAWVLRYLEEEPLDTVARLCGCSRSTAKRRVADAHRAVRKAFEK